ncbi:hypothetical protein [Brevundimonas sp. GCM10030266]|uniref:hypothetical protein n=1 Tax=Brevundimonas sp. GCM10030266 TaxID=3273386 RepID=UPI0036161C40
MRRAMAGNGAVPETAEPAVRLTGAGATADGALRFGVTERALARAVARVGEGFRDVQRELGGRR